MQEQPKSRSKRTNSQEVLRRGRRTVGDDGAGLRRDLELLGGELEHGGEGRRLGHAEPAGIQSGRGRPGSGSAEVRWMDGYESDPREREPVTHTLKGSLGSEVRMILKDTFPPPPPLPAAAIVAEKPPTPRTRLT